MDRYETEMTAATPYSIVRSPPELLGPARLDVDARMIREPTAEEKPRQGRQAYLLARKPESR
ncbi:hypothetical protein [Streptomyces sp. NPDC096193]|uniref:hypothetical protein n=2 Tax=unclassified Streptomyces TaxID=2593676 RepID=UPI003317995B